VIGSDAIDFEILLMPDNDKRLMVQILSTIFDTHVKVDAGLERRAVELKRTGLKAMDALHVACAEKGKADILLTTDDNFLSKTLKIQRTRKVKVENPLRWVLEVLKSVR
jgi:predicted nucleic acid-binding protein